MASIPSHATPEMLSWARKTAGFNEAFVEQKEKLADGIIAQWEAGEGSPTFAVLKRLAKRYKRPLPVFYLPAPPTAFSVVKDFRTFSSDSPREFSPELRFAIRVAQERQSWASEYLKEEGYPKPGLAGSLTRGASVAEAAAKVADSLKVASIRQAGIDSPSAAYRFWRRACEAAGVFVFGATKVDSGEMRGLALSDDYAPAIVVNNSDSYEAKCFTLIHEIVHILSGDTAISGQFPFRIEASAGDPQERFCNQVATEFLVPKADFRGRIPSDWKRRYLPVIRTLARRYWVSPSVIAIRLYETGFADHGFVSERLKEAKNVKPKKREGPLRIPQQTLAISRVGESFSRTAISAYRSGEIGCGELSSMLNLRMKHLPALEQEVYPNSVHPLTPSETE